MKFFIISLMVLVASACSVKPNIADSPDLNRANPSPRLNGPDSPPVKEEIRKVINANIRGVRVCYEKALDRNPKAQGKLVAQWSIKGDGTVDEVVASQSTLDDPEMVTCILGKIRTWKFIPPPEDQVQVVSYPFSFMVNQ